MRINGCVVQKNINNMKLLLPLHDLNRDSTSRRTCSSCRQTPCCFRDGIAQMLNFPEKWIAARRLPSGERLILKIPSYTGTVCAVNTKDLWIKKLSELKQCLASLHVTHHHEQQRTANVTPRSLLHNMTDSTFALASPLPTSQCYCLHLLQTHMCKHQKCIPSPITKISQFYSPVLKDYEFLEIHTDTWE